MGKLLFVLQLVLIATLLYFADYEVLLSNPYLFVPLFLAIIFGFYAYWSMKAEIYSLFPEPVENHKLVTVGAYRYTRHPMYAVYALVGLLLMLSNFQLKTSVLFVLLLVVLEVTADIEEKLLSKKHPKYREYQKITKKFIPFIY